MWKDLIDIYPGAPESNIKLGIIFGIIVLSFLFFFLAPKIRKKTENKALKKIIAKSRGGLLGFPLTLFLLVWFRLETVPLLSMRLWLILTLVGYLVWCIWKIMTYHKIQKRITQAENRRRRK